MKQWGWTSLLVYFLAPLSLAAGSNPCDRKKEPFCDCGGQVEKFCRDQGEDVAVQRCLVANWSKLNALCLADFGKGWVVEQQGSRTTSARTSLDALSDDNLKEPKSSKTFQQVYFVQGGKLRLDHINTGVSQGKHVDTLSLFDGGMTTVCVRAASPEMRKRYNIPDGKNGICEKFPGYVGPEAVEALAESGPGTQVTKFSFSRLPKDKTLVGYRCASYVKATSLAIRDRDDADGIGRERAYTCVADLPDWSRVFGKKGQGSTDLQYARRGLELEKYETITSSIKVAGVGTRKVTTHEKVSTVSIKRAPIMRAIFQIPPDCFVGRLQGSPFVRDTASGKE